MVKRLVVLLLLAGLLVAGVYGFNAYKAKLIGAAMARIASAPQTVSTETVAYADWQDSLKAVGSLVAARGVELSTEVTGIVDEIDFKSGQTVAANAVVVRLRPDDLTGRLKQLREAVNLAQINYQRDLRQIHAQAVAQSVVDTDLSSLRSAQAQVEQQQALLAERVIQAPFAGRLGLRQVNLGQYINPGASIVSLQQLDPIYLDFTLPQQDIASIAIGQTVTALTDAYPGQRFAGIIEAVEATLDLNTRNLTVRAVLSNPDGKLIPGMAATVIVSRGTPHRLLRIRQTSVAFNAYGSTAFVVTPGSGLDADGKRQLVANQRFITTGETAGDVVAVLAGLQEGDVVVTAGQIKLHNGSVVLVNNSVQPSADPDPALTENR